MSRILKWTVPIDDQWHEVGTGPVALVAKWKSNADYMSLEGPFALVWTIEPAEDDPMEAYARELNSVRSVRRARVYGTGQDWPSVCDHLGSYVDGPLVWHVIGISGTEDKS